MFVLEQEHHAKEVPLYLKCGFVEHAVFREKSLILHADRVNVPRCMPYIARPDRLKRVSKRLRSTDT